MPFLSGEAPTPKAAWRGTKGGGARRPHCSPRARPAPNGRYSVRSVCDFQRPQQPPQRPCARRPLQARPAQHLTWKPAQQAPRQPSPPRRCWRRHPPNQRTPRLVCGLDPAGLSHAILPDGQRRASSPVFPFPLRPPASTLAHPRPQPARDRFVPRPPILDNTTTPVSARLLCPSSLSSSSSPSRDPSAENPNCHMRRPPTAIPRMVRPE